MCTRHPAVPPQRRGLFATLLLAVLCVIWGPASAQEEPPQQQCGPLEKIQELVGKYGEAPLASMASDKGPLWLFVNPETGTFTLAVKISPTAGCLFATGDGFRPLAHAPAKPKAAPVPDAPS